MVYMIGKMDTFTDASGATVRYFNQCRGLNRATYWRDLTAKSKGAATRLVNMATKKAITKNDYDPSNPIFALDSREYIARVDYYNPLCWTRNMLNPKAGLISIRAAAYGGCCDPGTERYHCM